MALIIEKKCDQTIPSI